MIDTFRAAKEVEQYVVETRRWLHLNPELSMHEHGTISFVCEALRDMGIPYEIIPDGGIIATITGDKIGKTIILRADLDALPLQEAKKNLATNKIVVSNIEGVAHTCGHDAHTAMLLGVARVLVQNKQIINGKVLLVFEQGEEIGGGIFSLLKRLTEIGADGVWGIHVKNDLESGKISVDAGPRMASPMPFHVKITGKSGHGSRPDLAHSPIDCFTEFYQRVSTMRLTALDPHKPITFSIGTLKAGAAANIIPESLDFSGTFRYLHPEQGNAAAKEFVRLLEETCRSHQCSYTFEKEPRALDLIVNNHEQCALLAANGVEKSIGSHALATMPAWMASEPFAYYQRYFPGVFAFLGIENSQKGTGADHHNPHFDVDEDVLIIGVAATLQYTLDFLNNDVVTSFGSEQKSVEELFASR